MRAAAKLFARKSCAQSTGSFTTRTARREVKRGIAANGLTQRMLACRAVSNSAPRSLLAVERRSVVARELVERNRRLPRYLGDDIRHLGSKRFHHVLKYFQQRVGRPIRHASTEQALPELFRWDMDVAHRFTERRRKFLGYFAIRERFRSGDRVSLSLVTALGESLERNGRNVAHID